VPVLNVIRSMLFVPGNRTAWAAKGFAAGADAVALDLEDAVSQTEKATARDAVATYLRSTPSGPVFVRINALRDREALDDLRAVAVPALAGVLIPKTEHPREVFLVERLLDWFEADTGIAPGQIRIVPLLETARGMRRAHAICRSSRVAYAGGLGVRGGDIERSLGYRFSADGTETLAMRSTVLLDVRARGVPNPLTGMWTDVHDLDGLRRFAQQGRDLGYEGMLAIHPAHIPVINDVFSLSADQRADDEGLVAAAEASADGAILYKGRMVDKAMVETARARLARFRDSRS
jgi:citrate lyase subunit beta / citryl-CoA lyase